MHMKQLIGVIAVAASMGLSAAPGYSADVAADAGKKTSQKKAGKKVYEEASFVKLISNKSKQQITDLLGAPVSKAQASKPSGAEAAVQKFGTLDNTKKDSVEMWYYKNLVKSDAKHTFSKVELTFVNDRCQNVAYFNE
jgi:hypothetical protein